MTCELNAGSVMGTIKFESIIPWDIDGDIFIEKADYNSYVNNVFPKLKQLNKKMVSDQIGVRFNDTCWL